MLWLKHTTCIEFEAFNMDKCWHMWNIQYYNTDVTLWRIQCEGSSFFRIGLWRKITPFVRKFIFMHGRMMSSARILWKPPTALCIFCCKIIEIATYIEVHLKFHVKFYHVFSLLLFIQINTSIHVDNELFPFLKYSDRGNKIEAVKS